MFQQNESKHLDLVEWLDTLEELGVDLGEQFPAVVANNNRIDRLNRIKSQHAATRRDPSAMARQLGLIDDLDDVDAILSTADHFAYSEDEGHRARVAELLDRAIDTAMGEAVRRFRHADVLAAIRPAFDVVAARIVEAAEIIPDGVLNLDDAARVGHAQAYLQLEADVRVWGQLAELIEAWNTAGVFPPEHGSRFSVEFMVEDPNALRDATAGLGRPTRRARGIAAGRPSLRLPGANDAKLEPYVTPREAELASYDANDADRASREAVGLSR